MNIVSKLVTASVLLAGLAACTITPANNASGSTSEQLYRCHAGCDKMKFFGCSSAAELSRCYSDCDSAAPKNVEVFVSCAENLVCDSACRTNITPAPATSSSSGSSASTSEGGSSSGGGGVPASSCETACTKLTATCNMIPAAQNAACVEDCTKNGYQYQIDCINNNQCSDLVKRCGATSSSTSSSSSSGSSGQPMGDLDTPACLLTCDTLKGRMCISATEHSSCRLLCNSASGAKKSTFSTCAQVAPECADGKDCLATFSD